MEQQTLRKTFTYQPIPTQQRELGRVLGLCRCLSTPALEQRSIALRRAGLSRSQQQAALKDLHAQMAESTAIHSPLVRAALARLPGLRDKPAPGPQCSQEQRAARAEPSGRGWGSGFGEPSSRGAVAHMECQRRPSPPQS